MAQSPQEIIVSILFGAAMALVVAYVVYTLMLIWDRVASLSSTLASYVSSKIRLRRKPASAIAKPAFTMRRMR
jgi:hypothetical protein